MKIIKGAIEQLASEGYITIQVPQYAIDFAKNSIPVEVIPDDWIETLKNNNRRCCGKETGFWFLTKKGWEARKEKIKEAFLASKHQRGTWEQFEAHVAGHFAAVEKASKTYLKFLRRKLNEYESKVSDL